MNVPPEAPWYVRWLVAEWKDAWRWLSIQLAALIAIAPQLYEALPEFKEAMPADVFHYLLSGLGVAAILGRVAKQQDRAKIPAAIKIEELDRAD